MRSLAERVEQLTVQARELEQGLAELIERQYPELLEPATVGRDHVAQSDRNRWLGGP
ncbi:hypothetical protein [Streptomyces violascens]|uniref:hypothetical protein n=1 Tax=Streptomyces violascens TaxID=67381 RepID=UPI0036A30B0E